jgi:hypothetical protein
MIELTSRGLIIQAVSLLVGLRHQLATQGNAGLRMFAQKPAALTLSRAWKKVKHYGDSNVVIT